MWVPIRGVNIFKLIHCSSSYSSVCTFATSGFCTAMALKSSGRPLIGFYEICSVIFTGVSAFYLSYKILLLQELSVDKISNFFCSIFFYYWPTPDISYQTWQSVRSAGRFFRLWCSLNGLSSSWNMRAWLKSMTFNWQWEICSIGSITYHGSWALGLSVVEKKFNDELCEQPLYGPRFGEDDRELNESSSCWLSFGEL